MIETTEPTAEGGGAERLIAGWCAVTFATLVLLSNVIAGSTPGFDASPGEVARYIADHRTANAAGVALFALAAPCMAAFACAFYGRLRAACRPADMVWARIGTVGAILLVPLFAAVMVNRIVLVVGSDEIINRPALVALVWRLEMAAFMLNMLAVALALVGLGLAGARSGLLPAWFGRVAPFVAGCAVLAPVTTIASLEGSEIGLVGMVAFFSWMVLLYLAGYRQLRRRPALAPAPAITVGEPLSSTPAG
jgi:hypothetical protein